MRNNLIILLLILASANAWAGWQRLGENSAETAYVDAAQKRDHNRVRMWGLFDLKTPRAFGDMTYSSMKIQREYHCKDKQSRIISMAAFAGNMGSGDMIYSTNTPEKWAAIQPDSVEEALWYIACDKKSE